jgi:predicted ester cyclase
MHRTVLLPAATVIAVLIAIALLVSGLTLTHSAATPVGADDAAAVARSFYAAANGALASGDTASLARILAPDFVDHAALPGSDSTRAGFLRSVLALRAVFPALRLVVEDLVAGGGEAAARLRVTGDTPANFLGFVIPGVTATWEPVEVLRVEGGQVLERWGAPPERAAVQPLFRAPVSVPPGSATATDRAPVVSLRIERLTFQAGSRLSGTSTSATSVISVEAGRLVDEGDGPSGVVRGSRGSARVEMSSTGQSIELDAGDALVLPAGTRRELLAGGDGATVLETSLEAVAFPGTLPPGPSFSGTSPTPLATGVTSTLLAAAHPDVALGDGRLVAQAVRLVVPAGAFVLGGGDSPLCLAIVEGGTLAADIGGAPVQGQPGTSLSLLKGNPTAIRNAGPDSLTLLVVDVASAQ